jgi:hypothetical protein
MAATEGAAGPGHEAARVSPVAIEAVIAKRVSLLVYLRRVVDGQAFWMNSVFVSREALEKHLGEEALGARCVVVSPLLVVGSCPRVG